jgi:hypothetical protein
VIESHEETWARATELGRVQSRNRAAGLRSALPIGDRQASRVTSLGGGGSGEVSQPKRNEKAESGIAEAAVGMTTAPVGKIAQQLREPQLGAHIPTLHPAPVTSGLEHRSQSPGWAPSALAAIAMSAITLVAETTCKLVPRAKTKAMSRTANLRPNPSFVGMGIENIERPAGQVEDVAWLDEPWQFLLVQMRVMQAHRLSLGGAGRTKTLPKRTQQSYPY